MKRGQSEQKVLAGAICHRGVERGSFVMGDPCPSGNLGGLGRLGWAQGCEGMFSCCTDRSPTCPRSGPGAMEARRSSECSRRSPAALRWVGRILWLPTGIIMSHRH